MGQFPNAEAPACPLCRGELAEADGLWHCQGRCRARWLATAAWGPGGGWLDVAALPFGLCGCCMPPLAMAQGRDGLAVCPGSGEDYLLLADGSSLALRDTPFGLCQCCAPPRPLARQAEAVVCAGRPHQAYELTAAGWRPLREPPADASRALAEIDAALRRNAARLNVNGLFDFD